MKRQVTIFVIISFILALSPALVQAQETETDIKKKELEDKKKKEAELIKKLQIEEQKRQTDEWEGQRGIMVLENAIHEEELQKAVEEARAAITLSRGFEGALDNYYIYGASAP